MYFDYIQSSPPNILGHVVFYWKVVDDLEGTILLGKSVSQYLTVANTSTARGQTVWPSPLCLLRFGLFWAFVGFIYAVEIL